MAAQKGRSLLMKIGDGASPEAFTTIGGMRSTSIAINDEMVDVTNKDSGTNTSTRWYNVYECKWFRSIYRLSFRNYITG